MKMPSLHILLIAVALSALCSIAGIAHSQTNGLMLVRPDLSCSPAPCVLPPTQASEGGGTVTDSPIATDPLNGKRLLLGAVDFNCGQFGVNIGSYFSRDGGTSWIQHCMLTFVVGRNQYSCIDEPAVTYDRKGAAYLAALCQPQRGNSLVIAVQKSTDGIHWNKPVVALRQPGTTGPNDPWLTADVNPGSPWLNSLYASAWIRSHQGGDNQIVVSHSNDGGATWTPASVDAVQKYPAEDRDTRVAAGADGTVYVTWMHCPAKGPDNACDDDVGYMMFSKSGDGGNTWSSPRLMTKAVFPPFTGLPNTGQGVGDPPLITVDDSKGAYTGNLYVAIYAWTGTYMRVQVIRSTDGGKTWSQPVPVAPPSATHDQFFPSISVSSTGQVGVSWLDRRNDPANISYQAFAAFSDDGGKTFGKNWQLTQAFSNPDNNGTQNNWMGDYTGNTFAGNDFIAAWMDSSNGFDMQEVVGGVRLK